MENCQIKLIDGTRHEIDLKSEKLKSHFTNQNNFTREILHQFNNEDYYKDYISEQDEVILDIGANVGLFSLHVSPYAKSVYAFEPTPSHFGLQEEIIGDIKHINRFELAVSDKTGETTFYTSSSNSTMNSLINRNESSFVVKTISIKDIFKKFKIKKANFVKIDIEGSEVITLTDEAIKVLAEKANKVLIEFHEVDGKSSSFYRDEFKQKFESAGFNTKSFNEDGLFCSK